MRIGLKSVTFTANLFGHPWARILLGAHSKSSLVLAYLRKTHNKGAFWHVHSEPKRLGNSALGLHADNKFFNNRSLIEGRILGVSHEHEVDLSESSRVFHFPERNEFRLNLSPIDEKVQHFAILQYEEMSPNSFELYHTEGNFKNSCTTVTVTVVYWFVCLFVCLCIEVTGLQFYCY